MGNENENVPQKVSVSEMVRKYKEATAGNQSGHIDNPAMNKVFT